MATIYPNWLYHPDTGTEIFIDSLQTIGNTSYCDVTEYRSSENGKRKTFTQSVGSPTLSLAGKIDSDNENTIRRQLQYLLGKQIYIGLGAEELATLCRIRSYNMQKSVKSKTPLVLDIICDGSSEGQFWEAEACTNDGSDTTDTLATGGISIGLNSIEEYARIAVYQSDIVLPAGNYTMFVRAYDTNQITDDFGLVVYNMNDLSEVISTTETLASSYGIYTLDFEITSDEAGDQIRLIVQKETSTTNVIYVDFMGFVRTD